MLEQIKKYECVDKNIFVKACKIISQHYGDSPFIFSLYFFDIINFYSTGKVEMVAQYKDDIQLLEDIYLKNIMVSSDTDSGFLKSYLEKAASQTQNFYGSSDPWFSRLLFIWQDDDFLNYMDSITNHLLSLETAGSLRPLIATELIGYLFTERGKKKL